MKKLTYYIQQHDAYEAFYEYKADAVGADEFYARQLCHYFIVRGTQYELVANEMAGDEEVLILKQQGRNLSGEDERDFRGQGIFIEFRSPKERENFRLYARMPVSTHYDVLRYLLKDVVDIEGIGQKRVTSTEIDEDRGVYVLYVEAM